MNGALDIGIGNDVNPGPVSAPETKLSEHDVDWEPDGRPEIKGPGAVGKPVNTGLGALVLMGGMAVGSAPELPGKGPNEPI